MSYLNFVESKNHYGAKAGIPIERTSPAMFDYQKFLAARAAEHGRYGNFIDTGMGKTVIELTLAQHYAEKTNKPSLILTPLAVAYQFELEAAKFDFCGVHQTKDGTHSGDVVTCNYERVSKLNPDDFGCVILDESSILKSYDGMTSSAIVEFLKRVKYRFLFTATPAPNDFIELGTSSEALGFMGHMDMLSTFFTNKEKTSDPSRIGSPWFLKPHAEDDFFAWVNSWSVSVRRPSDIGFDDTRFDLPELIENDQHIDFQVSGLESEKLTFKDIRRIQKESVTVRCEMAADLSQDHDTSVFWCHRNDESAMLADVAGCTEINGSMSLDKKEEILIAFAQGQIKKIVTKPRITGFGLNWQHCQHTVYFPTYSYEQYYQSIRRFWRYGQSKPVTVDRVFTLAEMVIMKSLSAKSDKATALYRKMNDRLKSNYIPKAIRFSDVAQKPIFMRSREVA